MDQKHIMAPVHYHYKFCATLTRTRIPLRRRRRARSLQYGSIVYAVEAWPSTRPPCGRV